MQSLQAMPLITLFSTTVSPFIPLKLSMWALFFNEISKVSAQSNNHHYACSGGTCATDQTVVQIAQKQFCIPVLTGSRCRMFPQNEELVISNFATLDSSISAYINEGKMIEFPLKNETRNILKKMGTTNPIISNPYFFNFPALDIIDHLIYVNAKLVGGDEGGEFRNDLFKIRKQHEKAIQDYRETKAMINSLINMREGSLYNTVPEDILRIYKEYETLINLMNEAEMKPTSFYLENLPLFEKTVLGKYVYLPVPPNQIREKLALFIRDLKKYDRMSILPVSLAAWVHSEFLKILPFKKGNGVIARSLLNAIFVRRGLEPLEFPSEEKFLSAVQKNDIQPGSFVHYLIDEVIPWNRDEWPKIKELRNQNNAYPKY